MVFLVYVSFNFTGFTFCKTVFDQILMCSCVTLETYEGLSWFVAQALEASPRKKKKNRIFFFLSSVQPLYLSVLLPQAVRLESSYPQVTRYMVVVSTNGRQDTEESIVLGIDFLSSDRLVSLQPIIVQVID